MIDAELLHRFLGVEYHNYLLACENPGLKLSKCSCGLTGMSVWDNCTKDNLRFDNYTDAHLLLNKLKDNLMFYDFLTFCLRKHMITADAILISEPEEICELISEYLISERLN